MPNTFLTGDGWKPSVTVYRTSSLNWTTLEKWKFFYGWTTQALYPSFRLFCRVSWYSRQLSNFWCNQAPIFIGIMVQVRLDIQYVMPKVQTYTWAFRWNHVQVWLSSSAVEGFFMLLSAEEPLHPHEHMPFGTSARRQHQI